MILNKKIGQLTALFFYLKFYNKLTKNLKINKNSIKISVFLIKNIKILQFLITNNRK